MRESLLKQYFEGEVSAQSLKVFLDTIIRKNELKREHNLICDLKDDYTVKLEHLIALCNDYLNKTLDAEDISGIAFFLQGSDHFDWDNRTEDGAVIADVLDDWCTPEIDYPINPRNIKMVKRGLYEGVYDTSTLSMD